MSPTGEQPKAETPLSENSTVRVSLVVTMLGLAFAAGSAHWRIGALEKENSDQAVTIKALEKENASVVTRLTLSESNGATMKETLKEMNAKLDRILERDTRTSPAVYRGQPRSPGQ